MKNLLIMLVISCVVTLSDFQTTFAQASFNTGTIGVTINTYGRFRVYTPDENGTIQVQRLSLLVGMNQNAVFDYTNDADNEEATTLVSNPQMSDFEISGAYNNAYSGDPPNVLERLNVYGWNNASYAILRFYVKNREASAFNAIIGVETITEPDGAYGFDTVSYDAANDLIRSHRGGENIGFKLLSHPLISLTAFEWYSGYTVDSDYWTWLNHGTIDPQYISNTADGPVFITAQDPISINPQDSVAVYYAVSVGADETEMISNMDLAVQKYNQIVPVELTSFEAFAGNNFITLQWNTASETNNRGFEIQRMITNENTSSGWITIGFKDGAGTTTEPKTYEFTDAFSGINSDRVSYRLKQVDFNGTYKYSNTVEVQLLPVSFSLNQNYPNPFNPSTKISFSLPSKQYVVLKIYNTLGQEVSTLINREMEAGSHSVNFNAGELTSGMYIYTIKAGNFHQTKKMLFLK